MYSICKAHIHPVRILGWALMVPVRNTYLFIKKKHASSVLVLEPTGSKLNQFTFRPTSQLNVIT